VLHEQKLSTRTHGRSASMNSRDIFEADAPFSIEELEARFEMEAIAGPAGIGTGTDWKCGCTLEF
jgi:hypothetical protein